MGAAAGSVLRGGGSAPGENATVFQWVNMTDYFQRAAMATRLGIPLIYGIDAVHGNNNIYGATIFPHNVGLGCTRCAFWVQLLNVSRKHVFYSEEYRICINTYTFGLKIFHLKVIPNFHEGLLFNTALYM